MNEELKQNTNWYEWNKEQKQAYAKKWNDYLNKINQHSSNEYILSDDEVNEAINLINELSKDEQLNYYEDIISRERVNDFLIANNNAGDPLSKTKYTKTITDLNKDNYVIGDDLYLYNVTLGKIKEAFEELGNINLTAYKDFYDEIDDYYYEDKTQTPKQIKK